MIPGLILLIQSENSTKCSEEQLLLPGPPPQFENTFFAAPTQGNSDKKYILCHVQTGQQI